MIDSIYLKSCCAGIYGTDLVRLVFGGSLHPGGSALTERLGRLVGIGSGSRVLDLAAGRGLTAVHLARSFGCEVVGVEYSAAATQAAYRAARLDVP